MKTENRQATTFKCDACHATVPDAAFCGSCGAEKGTPVTATRKTLRPRVFIAAPRESLLLPRITSSLCPHLADADRLPFRHGVALALLALVGFSLLRYLPALVVLTTLGIPLLFVVYLWRSQVFRDIPARALVLTSAVGAGLGAAWWLWLGKLVASAYSIPLAVGLQLTDALNTGLVTFVVDTALMLLPAVVVRFSRLTPAESLDGFIVGALGALAYTAGGTIAWIIPQFLAGLFGDYRSGKLLTAAIHYGVFETLTAAAAGGMLGLALWFRPARRIGQPKRTRVKLALGAALGAALCMAVRIVEASSLPWAQEIAVNLILTVLALIALRTTMQLAVLHERPDPPSDKAVRCVHCTRVVPDMPFCPECGSAARSCSRSARRLRQVGEGTGG